MYYFAYGSNMNWPQMKQRCPSARFVSVACLNEHLFAITRQSWRRLCGTADVVPESGSEVWGILYDIDDSEVGALDSFEDGYRRKEMPVVLNSDSRRPLKAWIYVAEREADPPLPNAVYKRLMVEGARYWGLPQAYIEMLETLEVAME